MSIKFSFKAVSLIFLLLVSAACSHGPACKVNASEDTLICRENGEELRRPYQGEKIVNNEFEVLD